MKRLWLTVSVSLLVLALGCSTIQEIENPNGGQEMGNLGGGFTNPGAREGKYAMDRELCWQGIRADAPTDEAMQAAYEECMEKKGWSPQP